MSERAQALEAALRECFETIAGWRIATMGAHQAHVGQFGTDHLARIAAVLAAVAPAGGVSPQPDTRRDCTCLGTCKGADGLSPRYRCALSPASLSPVEPTPDKRTTGLHRKFIVTRTDGRSAPGQKHDGCDYFVLDLTHDPHAVAALRAYAKSCRKDYPLLADDLERKLADGSPTSSDRIKDRLPLGKDTTT